MTRTIRHASLWAVTASLVAVLVSFGIFKYGSTIESRAYPIFENVTLTYIVRQEESADVLVTGTKSRDCTLQGSNIKVLKNGSWRNAGAIILDADNNPVAFDDQRVAVDSPFVRRVRIEPSGSEIKIILEAKCHSFWTSFQELPPVKAQAQQDNSDVAQR